MKSLKTLIISSLLFLTALSASAMPPRAGRPSTSPQLFGRMMPYDLGQAEPLMIPDSLSVSNIVYLARHGARYMTSEKKFARLLETLESEKRSDNLSPAGVKFLTLLDSVKARSHGKWGLLSDVGAREERFLAENLDSLLPGFFKGKWVTSYSTYVPRVVETMDIFTYNLQRLNPSTDFWSLSGPVSNTVLRFFVTDSIYHDYLEHGAWKEDYRRACANAPARPALALFKKAGNNLRDEAPQLTLEMYEVLSSLAACGMPAPDDSFLSPAEFEDCWKISNYQQWLTRSSHAAPYGMYDALDPLLQYMMKDLLDPKDDTVATLYFAHAETLLPILAALGIPGNDLPADASPADVARVWRNFQLAPLGANLLLIAATSPSGKTFISARLNGLTVPDFCGYGPWVPLPTAGDYLSARLSPDSAK